MEGDPTPRKNSRPLMAAVQRICLVTPSHLAMNPRLVKEANALSEARYRVHVIAGRFSPPMDDLDSEILRGAAWTFESVGCRSSIRCQTRKLVRHGLLCFEHPF